ncbi:PIN domain-containing protein [Rhizobium sp. Rhizsp82]|uniref:PIN domain-containing protein n=1 Tax=Rhizobium sp. Rhizsp82 TaxID=3243057 RepID=UPI0039B54D75
MDGAFLLDTSVISETSKKYPRPEVIHFLEDAETLILPLGTLLEMQMGIQKVAVTNPTKAVKLSIWYSELTNGEIEIMPSGPDVADKWAVLAVDPRLHTLTINQYSQGRPRGGQDLHIAAASLASGIPIATFNVRDFVLINEHYPLPGIYDPATGIWHAKADLERTEITPPQLGPANSNHEPRRELKFLMTC